jgi:murein DD-endopeptidase MepM/ murein hydrolase activator NlpD
LDYLPPDDNHGHCDYVEVSEVLSQRNLWLFLCLIVLPIALIVSWVSLLKQIDQSSGSEVQVAVIDSDNPQIMPVSATGSSVVDRIGALTKTADAIKPIMVTIKNKDNLRKIFKRIGLDEKNAAAILNIKKAKVLKNLRIGKTLSFTLDSTKNKLQTLEYVIDDLSILIITAAKGSWHVETKRIKPTTNTKYAAATINGSIYSAGKKVGVPSKLVAQLANIFGKKVGINKIRNGDKFALFYKEYTFNGKKVRDSEIAAAELIHKGEIHRIVSFTDPYGHTSFYTPNGHSLTPVFDRYPISFKRIGSRFSHARLHPILGTVRAHLGVDLSASSGEPVKSTSNGRIVFAGNRGGHGKVVIIKHGIYETLYAHLSRFSNSIYSGGYVKKGQTIGYVGSSGLATGPHLHYEVHVNGIAKDPLKIRLPIGEMIASEHRGSFFAHSKKMLAQLDLHRKNS